MRKDASSHPGPSTCIRIDFPGDEWRRIQKPTGMRYILVNGAVTFEENECTSALSGKLLRSYDMINR